LRTEEPEDITELIVGEDRDAERQVKHDWIGYKDSESLATSSEAASAECHTRFKQRGKKGAAHE
jgi:hypothetical protein